MNSFVPRKLSIEEGSGDKLRQTRLFKNLKIEKIGKELGIQPSYLLALEEENFEALPAGLYGRNYLKKYADYLGLSSEELLKYWDEAMGSNNQADPFSQKVVQRNKFIIFPKIIRNILISLAIIICFLYLLFYFKKIVFPPSLEIIQPEKNLLIQASSITIVGQTEKEAEVKINGEIILNNYNGNFSQTINLKEGLNNIVITSKKKYSRERIITRQILVEKNKSE